MCDNLVAWLKANPAATFDAARDLLKENTPEKESPKVFKRAA
jgi:hypothetical protein